MIYLYARQHAGTSELNTQVSNLLRWRDGNKYSHRVMSNGAIYKPDLIIDAITGKQAFRNSKIYDILGSLSVGDMIIVYRLQLLGFTAKEVILMMRLVDAKDASILQIYQPEVE